MDSNLSISSQLAALPCASGQVAGGEAAGLVSSKTSPIGNKPFPVPQREGDRFDVTFHKEGIALNRVKKLKRSVYRSATYHSVVDHGFRPPVCWFVTLTYVGINDWRPDHISAATAAFRRHCKRIGISCRYTWVAELQSRGAVHYHLLAWLPHGVRMPKWDLPTFAPSGREAAPFWSRGMTNTQKAKSGVGYLMKYLSKLGELTVFPPNLRLYGIGGLATQGRQIRLWDNLPEWVKRLHGVGEVRRMGSLLVLADSGECLEPMFRCKHFPGGIRFTLLRDYPERWHSGPYSTWAPS